MRLRKMLLAGGALACFAGQSHAQSAAPDQAQAADEEVIVVTGRYTIDERIDTATGLGLTTRETPQSVTVITQQRITDQNLGDIADVVRNTAGVSIVEVDDVRNVFNARGFEITNYQIDGVPLSWSLAGDAAETLADVSMFERVELVRGATGLLTGAGDPSASINLVRKHADARAPEGYFSGALGSWEGRQIEGDIAGALSPNGTIRGRLVAKYEEGESYIDLFNFDKTVLYGVLEADLTERTTLRVGASRQQINPTAPLWGALPTFYDDGDLTSLPRSTSTSANWAYWDTTNTNYFANLVQDFANGWRLTLNYNRLINGADVELLYQYGVINEATGLGLATWPYKSDGESIQDSFDVQLRGDYSLFGRAHEFTIGALHSEQEADTYAFPASGPNAFLPATSLYAWDGDFPRPDFSSVGSHDQDIETEQTGYFVATRINAADSLKFIAGARMSSWERVGAQYGATQNYSADDVVIPYFGALYDLTPTHRLYASYTEIFQPQNLRDEAGATLDPIIGEAYEIGVKSAFFNDTLQSTIALFRIQQDGLGQPTGGVVPGSAPPEPAYAPAEGATSEGFEFELVGRIGENWNISVAYAQFEIEDSAGAEVNTDQPRQSFTLFATYDFTGALDGLTLGGGATWRSDTYSSATNPVTLAPARIEQDAYALVNLMGRYRFTEQVSLQANVENLFDKTYYSQISYFSQYRYGAPRNFSLALRYSF
ncbi:MAG: TonB-dependent siderophore receptor [Hydrogenophilaceae bacterium]|jgi:outer membrane receptor for ferric coprogen and ferric-rhodotorulic acid|nr:TonB-dependent siderophore receptor [Hydrogenophilaceae bacterium]